MKLYVVTSGCYSGYGIEKIFLDPEKARAFLLSLGWSDVRIEEYETADDQIEYSKDMIEKSRWLYGFEYHEQQNRFDKSEWQLREKKPVMIKDIQRRYKNTDKKIYVFLRNMDDERAWKILQDTLAIRKAREEGIT